MYKITVERFHIKRRLFPRPRRGMRYIINKQKALNPAVYKMLLSMMTQMHRTEVDSFSHFSLKKIEFVYTLDKYI